MDERQFRTSTYMNMPYFMDEQQIQSTASTKRSFPMDER